MRARSAFSAESFACVTLSLSVKFACSTDRASSLND